MYYYICCRVVKRIHVATTYVFSARAVVRLRSTRDA